MVINRKKHLETCRLKEVKSNLNEKMRIEWENAKAAREFQILPMEGRLRIFVIFCIKEVNKIRAKESRKSFAVRPREVERHEVGKIKRAISVKVTIEDAENQEPTN